MGDMHADAHKRSSSLQQHMHAVTTWPNPGKQITQSKQQGQLRWTTKQQQTNRSDNQCTTKPTLSEPTPSQRRSQVGTLSGQNMAIAESMASGSRTGWVGGKRNRINAITGWLDPSPKHVHASPMASYIYAWLCSLSMMTAQTVTHVTFLVATLRSDLAPQ